MCRVDPSDRARLHGTSRMFIGERDSAIRMAAKRLLLPALPSSSREARRSRGRYHVAPSGRLLRPMQRTRTGCCPYYLQQPLTQVKKGLHSQPSIHNAPYPVLLLE